MADVKSPAGELDKKKIAESVVQFLTISGWTAAKLARNAGVSQAMISQYLKGVYPGDNDSLTIKLNSIIMREKEKGLLRCTNPDFITTSVSKKFFGIAKMCRVSNKMGVCYARAGIGKTESAKEYAARNPEVILIRANNKYSDTVFLNELCDKMGLIWQHRNNNQKLTDCSEKLQGSNRLIIIDEAEQLPYKALETVRFIHDFSEVGILLTGMPKLLHNLNGSHGQYEQLSSRVVYAVQLDPLTDDDIRDIVTKQVGKTDDLWQVFKKGKHEWKSSISQHPAVDKFNTTVYPRIRREKQGRRN